MSGRTKPAQPPSGADASLDAGSNDASQSDLAAEMIGGSDASDASDAPTDLAETGADVPEAGCVGEGQMTYSVSGAACCPGLRYIVAGAAILDRDSMMPNCIGGIDPPGYCSRCGNGVCEAWEKPCGCPEDCGAPCGDKECPAGSYCRRKAHGTDAGTAAFECFSVASDCDGGVFSCQTCTALKTCGSTPALCSTQGRSARCGD